MNLKLPNLPNLPKPAQIFKFWIIKRAHRRIFYEELSSQLLSCFPTNAFFLENVSRMKLSDQRTRYVNLMIPSICLGRSFNFRVAGQLPYFTKKKSYSVVHCVKLLAPLKRITWFFLTKFYWFKSVAFGNEGLNQRNLKIWADVADKICFGCT